MCFSIFLFHLKHTDRVHPVREIKTLSFNKGVNLKKHIGELDSTMGTLSEFESDHFYR